MKRTGKFLDNIFPLRAFALLAAIGIIAMLAAGCQKNSSTTQTTTNTTETSTPESSTPETTSSTPPPAVTEQISGAGATFPYPIYSKWADTYQKSSGVGLNYQSIGSGGGIKQIQAKTVTFGASDAPLEGAELEQYGLVQFPMVLGGIVPVINVEGIAAGQLTLDGPTLANIFMGRITKWNDPAIAALNSGVTLPDTSIGVVTRSDGSGTTWNFTYYLSAVSEDWKNEIGTDKAVEWPVGIGAKGNEGVAQNVAGAKNSIGYVEYAYAKQNGMAWTRMINSAGQAVSPDSASFSAAAASADWNSAPGFGVILANQAGENSWPMTAATFILMYAKPDNDAASAAALQFFSWAYDNGDEAALELDYIPMPDSVVESVKATWASSILGSNGQPLI